MTKKITYLLIPAAMTCSAAMAQPAPSNQVLLSSEQMDQVTAGYTASVDANAFARGANYAVTGTTAVTQANVTPGATTEIAAGGAVAAANGSGAITNASVTPATSQPPGSITKTASISYVSPTLNIQVGAVGTVIPR